MFRIGEFSNIARVSKRLLHYYDQIGLLKPSYTDPETGYRFYRAHQLQRLNQILALKELELSLDQITQMLDSEISDEEIQEMLLLKKVEIEQQVSQSLLRVKQIEHRLLQNKIVDQALDVVIKQVPAQHCLCIRQQFLAPEPMITLVEEILRIIPKQIGKSDLGSFVGLFYAEDYSETFYDVTLGFLLNRKKEFEIRLSENRLMQVAILPAVETMATTVQIGNADQLLTAFGKIGRWIEANGYQITGPYREIGHEASTLEALNRSVIELQIPVAPLTHT